MTQQVVFNASPDDLQRLLSEAMAPLVDQIADLQTKVGQRKDFFSVEELAERTGFSTKTVRSWITEGRTVQGGKIVKLKIADNLTDGPYRVSYDAWTLFKSHFKDIAVSTTKLDRK